MRVTYDNPIKTLSFGFTKLMSLSIITTIIWRRSWSSQPGGGGGGGKSSVGTPTSETLATEVP